jgi:hypothetical protein
LQGKKCCRGIPEQDGRNDRETASTSGKEEDIRRCRANPGTGDYQISSRAFCPNTGTGGQITVEMSAPAEAEEVVPQRHLGERPRFGKSQGSGWRGWRAIP